MTTSPPALYRSSDVIRETFQFAAATVTAGAAGYWVGSPLVLVGAAGVAGALALGGGKLMESFFRSAFKRREVDTDAAPHLRGLVDDLSERSGFKEAPTLFDMEVNGDGLRNSTQIMNTPAQFQRVVNAAAISLKESAVIVSEPLLQLTDAEEQRAVLGHEFSHLASKHNTLHLVQGWLQSTTMFTAMFGVGSVAMNQGWIVGGFSIAGTFAISIVGNRLMPAPEDSFTREGEMKPEARRKRMAVWAAQETLSIGTLALVNPVPVLSAVAIEHGFFWTANLISKSHAKGEEYFADRNAVERYGASPLAVITLLRKMDAWLERDEPEVARAQNLRTGPWHTRVGKHVESFFWTHPQTEKRCAPMAKLARKKGYSEAEIRAALTDPVDISALPSRKMLIEAFDKEMSSEAGTAKREATIRELFDEIRQKRFERDDFIGAVKETTNNYDGPRLYYPLALAFRYAGLPIVKRIDNSDINKRVAAVRRLGCDSKALEQALTDPLDMNAMRAAQRAKKEGLTRMVGAASKRAIEPTP